MSDDQALLLQALADLSGTSLMPFLDGKAMDVESACFQDIGLTPPDKRVLDDTNWRLLFFSLCALTFRLLALPLDFLIMRSTFEPTCSRCLFCVLFSASDSSRVLWVPGRADLESARAVRASHRERVQADDEMLAMKQMLNQCQDQLRESPYFTSAHSPPRLAFA